MENSFEHDEGCLPRIISITIAATLFIGCLPMYVTYFEPAAPGSIVSRAKACQGTIETYLTVLEHRQGELRLILDSLEMRYAEDIFSINLMLKVKAGADSRFSAESAFAILEIPNGERRHLIDLRNDNVLLDHDIEAGKTISVELPLQFRRFYRFSYKDAGFDADHAVHTLPVFSIGESRIKVPMIELGVRRTLAIEYNC